MQKAKEKLFFSSNSNGILNIEYIEATGKAHVFDAWVELEHNKDMLLCLLKKVSIFAETERLL